MKLTHQDIKKISHLARLTFPDNQMDKIAGELNNILHLIEHLNQEDTDTIEPLAHPLEATQPLRPDLVSEHNERDLFLKNAPETDMGLYIVPQVIESE